MKEWLRISLHLKGALLGPTAQAPAAALGEHVERLTIALRRWPAPCLRAWGFSIHRLQRLMLWLSVKKHLAKIAHVEILSAHRAMLEMLCLGLGRPMVGTETLKFY